MRTQAPRWLTPSGWRAGRQESVCRAGGTVRDEELEV